MPTTGISIKPLKVKLLAGEQKATESSRGPEVASFEPEEDSCVSKRKLPVGESFTSFADV